MAEKTIMTGSFPDRGPAVFAVTISTLVVATIFLIARIVCKTTIVKKVSWDDYFIILAWILAAALTTTIDVGASFGLGRHDVNISGEDRLPLRRTEYVFSILYNAALMALKTSILVFYLRVSKDTQQVLRIASWIVLAIVNVAGVVLTLLNIFQCRPVLASFSYSYTGQAQCIPLLTQFICSAPVNIVTDLAILALPIPVLTGMRLPKRQKYILVITFSLGIFVTIVDVVRIYYLQQAVTTSPTTPNDPTAIVGDIPEFAWNASLSLMWSAVEVNVGLVCACIPTLKPLIVQLFPAVLNGPFGTPNSNSSAYTTSSDRDAGPGTHNGAEPHVSSIDGLAAPAPAQQKLSDGSDFVEFLSTPDALNDQINSPATRTTFTAQRSIPELRPAGATYFGFVNMKRPKSMLETSPSESMRSCIVVTVPFLLWGFSYGLLNSLNSFFGAIANMSSVDNIALNSVYFGGGYFLGPWVVGEWVLRHDEHTRFHRQKHEHRDPVGGFKATFILGLCIYGIGTVMFWPSAVLASFPGFMISNFVVGFGLAVLETAANPFIILCGPPHHAETRILVAQGMQGVAAVLSEVLAWKLFFMVGNPHPQSLTSPMLIDVQWVYLAITLLCVILALFLYYMPLPEVRDADLGRAAEHLPVDPKKRSLGGLQLRTVCILLAVMAQWTTVAARESMSLFFRNLVTAFVPGAATSPSPQPEGLALPAPDYTMFAHTAFAVSRFSAAYLTWLGVKYPHSRLIPSPRTLLGIFSLLVLLSSLLCVVLNFSPPTSNPNLMAIPMVFFFFGEGPLWPLIFAMGLRGQGDRTKRASAWLTMGASGPAFWPFVMYRIMSPRSGGGDGHIAASSGDIQRAFIVVVALLFFALAYPVFLTAVRDARDLVDPVLVHVRGRRFSSAGGEDPTDDHIGPITREQGMSLGVMAQARQRGRTGSTGGSWGSDGGLMRLFGEFGGFVNKRRREGSSSTAMSQSPKCEHREVRRE